MKKTIALLLALTLCIALLVSCGDKKAASEPADTTSPSTQESNTADAPDDDTGEEPAPSGDSGGLSGTFYKLDGNGDPTEDYMKFNSDGTCSLYMHSVDMSLDGTFSVSGNDVTLVSTEFDPGESATIDGDTFTWDSGFGDPDVYVMK